MEEHFEPFSSEGAVSPKVLDFLLREVPHVDELRPLVQYWAAQTTATVGLCNGEDIVAAALIVNLPFTNGLGRTELVPLVLIEAEYRHMGLFEQLADAVRARGTTVVFTTHPDSPMGTAFSDTMFRRCMQFDARFHVCPNLVSLTEGDVPALHAFLTANGSPGIDWSSLSPEQAASLLAHPLVQATALVDGSTGQWTHVAVCLRTGKQYARVLFFGAVRPRFALKFLNATCKLLGCGLLLDCSLPVLASDVIEEETTVSNVWPDGFRAFSHPPAPSTSTPLFAAPGW